jgi:competence protein ComEC
MIMVFYVLGILLEYIFCMSYEMMIYIFFVSIIVGIFIYKKGFVVVLFSIILLLGSLNFKVNNEYDGQLKSFLGKKVNVIGDVIDVSYKYKERIVMTLKVEAIVMDGKKYRLSRKICAKLKGQNDGFKSAIGKRIDVCGTLLEPEKRRNPKMFDYNMYLKGKNIYGILYGDVRRIEIIGKGNISFVI